MGALRVHFLQVRELLMGFKRIDAGPRYVKTIEFAENLPAEESFFQEGEYQRLTESGKIESLRVKIEPYPDELTLVNEIGNDDIKMKVWLVPGRTGLLATVTRRIRLKNLFVLKFETGESVIGVTGHTHAVKKTAEQAWFYDNKGTFISTKIDVSRLAVDFDEALLPILWKTMDDQEAARRLDEVRGLLESGNIKFA